MIATLFDSLVQQLEPPHSSTLQLQALQRNSKEYELLEYEVDSNEVAA